MKRHTNKSPTLLGWLKWVVVITLFPLLLWVGISWWDKAGYPVTEPVNTLLINRSKYPAPCESLLSWVNRHIHRLHSKVEARNALKTYDLLSFNWDYELTGPMETGGQKVFRGIMNIKRDGNYSLDPPIPKTIPTSIPSSGTWAVANGGAKLLITSPSGKNWYLETHGYFKTAGGNVFFPLPLKQGWTGKFRINM